MKEMSGDWRDYPYLVEWVAEMNQWARDYQIYEFIPADDDGQDPTGRTPDGRLPESENEGKIERRFIWTVTDNGSEAVISSRFSNGTWQNRGWYLGRVPHESEQLFYDEAKYACAKCEGTGFWNDSEAYETDCEVCFEGNSVFIDLESTDFHLVD